MKYIKPRLPKKEIGLCLDLFDKKEAEKRILRYIEGVIDDAEFQSKLSDMDNRTVFLIQQKDTMITCGLFDSYDKAKRYTGGSDNLAIQKIKVG